MFSVATNHELTKLGLPNFEAELLKQNIDLPRIRDLFDRGFDLHVEVTNSDAAAILCGVLERTLGAAPGTVVYMPADRAAQLDRVAVASDLACQIDSDGALSWIGGQGFALSSREAEILLRNLKRAGNATAAPHALSRTLRCDRAAPNGVRMLFEFLEAVARHRLWLIDLANFCQPSVASTRRFEHDLPMMQAV